MITVIEYNWTMPYNIPISKEIILAFTNTKTYNFIGNILLCYKEYKHD